MIIKKILLVLLAIPILAYWLILSPVIPDKNNENVYFWHSKDNNWKVGIYHVSVTTPVSFFQFLQEKKYIVLYNSKDEYIGQTTPFCLQPFMDFNILLPNRSHNSIWFLPDECDYNIPIDKPNWWSRIIKFRLSL